jgi:hypothetical protein
MYLAEDPGTEARRCNVDPIQRVQPFNRWKEGDIK